MCLKPGILYKNVAQTQLKAPILLFFFSRNTTVFIEKRKMSFDTLRKLSNRNIQSNYYLLFC